MDNVQQLCQQLKSVGLKGRFQSQICNKSIGMGTTTGDVKISPVIWQMLLHWGFEVTKPVGEA